MKTLSVPTLLSITALALAMPTHAIASSSDNRQQTCQTAWYQSAASQSCALVFMRSTPPDFCYVGAECLRPDGTRQSNAEQTRMVNIPLLRNCDGRLGFNC